MAVPASALQADWLGASRRATAALRGILADHPTSRERVVETGERGEGGDATLVIDQAAEDAVFAELDRLHARGARFCAVSEERGVVDFGDDAVRVVIDPIDGSLNAKRGLPHHAISIAVADGPTMADVAFGYVYDLGPDEEWVARRGEGAWLNGVHLDDPPPERRDRDGRLEVVAVESVEPRYLAGSLDALQGTAHRVRALGAMAVSLCQVAAGRVDGMVSLWRTRAVDVAAAQLIVRETGAQVAFLGDDGPLGAPLDVTPHAPVVAALTERGLAELSAVPNGGHRFRSRPPASASGETGDRSGGRPC
jgi:myo-inositol-1(or 4)-monophosphatase